MTRQEMVEIFAVMLLAYPNAETFKGGIQKLGPTIELWTACLPEVDFWTGKQAVIRLCRENKFPPTIAEFKEKADAVRAEINDRIFTAWTYMRLELADAVDEKNDLDLDIDKIVSDKLSRMAIRRMGGIRSLIVSMEPRLKWNDAGFCDAYEQILRGETPNRLQTERRQIKGGTNG